MLILIMDNSKLTKIDLSNYHEDHIIKYAEEIDINLEYIDNTWYLKSNGSVDAVIDNKIVSSVKLSEDNLYTLSINGQDEYSLLYCLNNNVNNKYVVDLNQINIGSSENNNIIYNSNLVAPLHACIYLEDDKWFIKAEQDWARIYVNNIRVPMCELNIGDIIYINGLKMIWMNKFFTINNSNIISINNLKPYTEEKNKVIDKIENDNLVLYEDKDCFLHVPRIRKVIEEKIVDIDEVPRQNTQEEQPLLLTFGASLMMMASVVLMGANAIDGFSKGKSLIVLIPQIFMVVAMLVGVILIPILTRKYRIKTRKEKEKTRQEKFTNYLNEKENNIDMLLSEEKSILLENSPSLNECLEIVNTKNRRLWEREISDEDFLNFRLGVGNANSHIKVNAPKEKFSLEDDNLKNRVFDLADKAKKLKDVPITFSLLDNNVSALICESTYNEKFINSILLQILTFHSPEDLKIVILTNKDKESYWKYIKYLPHLWDDNHDYRFFADNIEEMKILSANLEKIYNERKENFHSSELNSKDKEKYYTKYNHYYLIITDDYYNTRNVPFLDTILNDKENNLGFSLFIIDNNMKNIPNECDSFINLLDNGSSIFNHEIKSENQIYFNPEYIDYDISKIVKNLANIPVSSSETSALLPNTLSFLEMYQVGNIKQLNILNRWRESNPVISLEAPIGIHPNGDVFKLNLHEKFHGPHGLIAGSTGSGKSEFIITYILSMAINYHPDDVQFVLIDYKGGGLAGAFENREKGIKIPHLIGTITNLDTNEMNRTLISIQSELNRRQTKFNEARDKLNESTIDIYKYQKYYHEGLLDEAIAHLFIICDEFAELKNQQPEFMQQLISASRIGRSLGVHLVLATQKPSGVVNDQIWSNSRFKICFKVQSRSDSMEMLKRPEAASIKETGRFYLQVGYDELFEIGQSAWCGDRYIPTERLKKKTDTSISFINNTGYIIKSIDDIKKSEDNIVLGEQLNNIVNYLYEISVKENYHPKQLWLNKIPKKIYVDNLKTKYNYKPEKYVINSIIGEYDNPSKQKQGPVKIELTEKGNAIIFGLPTTGKENLLSTMIYSIAIDHSIDEVNMYILDFGSEILRMFSQLPHVGDIAYIEDKEKVDKLIDMLYSVIEKRKGLFAEYGGNYNDYIKTAKEPLPVIIIYINEYDNFQENFSKYEDKLYVLIREGNKFGIYFVVTTSTVGSIRSRLLQNFNNRMSMQLADPMDYRVLLGAPKGLVPTNLYGRGIVKIDDDGYEFQTAMIADKEKISTIVKVLSYKLFRYHMRKAPFIPILPKILYSSKLPKAESLSKIPVGIYKKDIEPAYYDFIKHQYTTICTNLLDDKLTFIDALLKKILEVPDIELKVIDAYQAYTPNIENLYFKNDNFELVIDDMYNKLQVEEKQDHKTIYFILGIGQLKARLDKEYQTKYITIFNSLKGFKNSYFICMDSIQAYRSIELDAWFKNNVSIADGIWLGEGFSNQNIIKVNNFTMDDRKVFYPEFGIVVDRGKFEFIKYMKDKAGENNEQ